MKPGTLKNKNLFYLIASSEEMNQIDSNAINNHELSSRVLMEHAGMACVCSLLRHFSDISNKTVIVLAGSGHNGGDGLVIARLLCSLGVDVRVYLTSSVEKLENEINDVFVSLKSVLSKIEVVTDDLFESLVSCIPDGSIVIDAMTGTGFKGSPRGVLKKLIEVLSEKKKKELIKLFSVDIPSGNGVDEDSEYSGLAVHATWAIQCLKPIHTNSSGRELCGEIEILNIGLPLDNSIYEKVNRYFVSPAGVSSLLNKYFPESNTTYKGSRGHVLVIGGSPGMNGAPVLSSIAAMRSGAGLVTVCSQSKCSLMHIPPEILHIEIDCGSDSKAGGLNYSEWDEILNKKNAIVIGPGLGKSSSSKDILAYIMHHSQKNKIPLVLDADALNLIASDKALQEFLSPWMVLTPHVGEFSRLFDDISIGEILSRKLYLSRELTKKFNTTLVLKGPGTVITDCAGVQFVNPHQLAVLGVAGTGDTLSGMIGAFLAKGFNSTESSLLAVYVHAEAAKKWSYAHNFRSGLLASEISDLIPSVMGELLDFKYSAYCNQKITSDGSFIDV